MNGKHTGEEGGVNEKVPFLYCILNDLEPSLASVQVALD